MKNKKNIQQRFKVLLAQFQAGQMAASQLDELKHMVQDESKALEIEGNMYLELENQDYQKLTAFHKEAMFKNLEPQLNLLTGSSRAIGGGHRFLNRLMAAAAILLLVIVGGGLTVYFLNSQQAMEELQKSYCEIVAAPGANTRVLLPDSSVVWLNAGSKLTYSTGFNRDNRLVLLEGEGYFQVAQNEKLPFVVDADGFLVEGDKTEFNVKAYNSDPTIEALLVEGKVWINHRTEKIASDVSLGRKYKATFYRRLNSSAIIQGQPRLVISPNVDPEPLISWKNDLYIHQNCELLNKSLFPAGMKMVILHDNVSLFLRKSIRGNYIDEQYFL